MAIIGNIPYFQTNPHGNDGGLQLLTKTGHRKVGSGWVPRLHRPSLPVLDLRLNNVEQTEGKTQTVTIDLTATSLEMTGSREVILE